MNKNCRVKLDKLKLEKYLPLYYKYFNSAKTFSVRFHPPKHKINYCFRAHNIFKNKNDLNKEINLIYKSLHQKGLRGLLPRLIQNYLKSRLFQVRVSNVFSTSQPQLNGIPQDSPLSGPVPSSDRRNY